MSIQERRRSLTSLLSYREEKEEQEEPLAVFSADRQHAVATSPRERNMFDGMQQEFIESSLWRKASKLCAPFLIEFLGTFYLVLAVSINVTQGVFGPFAGIAIGVTLMVSVFFGGHISGGHYNPAVTLAVAITRRGKISVLTACIYIVVQVLASIAAAFVSWGLLGETFHPAPGENVLEVRAVFAEAIWTFLLATVVLQTGTTATQAGNSFFGLAIGFTVLAGAIGVGPISGGVFNPAVGTGPTIVDAINNGSKAFKYLWIYWVGPLSGGLVAGMVFWFTNFTTEFLPVYDKVHHHEEPASLFTPEAVPSLGDRTAQVSKVTKKFEKRLENKILHPHSSSYVEAYTGSEDDDGNSSEASLNSDRETLLKPEKKKKKQQERGGSMYGGGNLPSLADRTAEASKNTKEFAKRLV